MSQAVATLRHPTGSSRPSRRTLGNTGLQVSIIGFGASPLGDVFGIADPAEGVRAVHHAINEDINFFDVSPYYGLTLAEERLGEALAGRRGEVVLSTKCGRYGAAEFDFSAQRIRQGLEASLKRLRTDYVDVLHAHDVEFGDARQIIDETIPAMRQLQQEGKVRYVGISGYPPQFLMRIAQAVPVDTILNYCHYNLLASDLNDELAPFAESRGIGLINASPLHMGVLTEQGAPTWHPAPAGVHRAVREAVEYCHSRGVDLSEIALAYCLRYPHVATTLVGMSTTLQVQRNISAAEDQIDPDVLKRIEEILAPVHNTQWPTGRPENN
jgi:L-galactose dehydrogenase